MVVRRKRKERGSSNNDNGNINEKRQLSNENAKIRELDKNYVINAILKKMAGISRNKNNELYAWAYVFKLFDSIQSTAWTTRILQLRKTIKNIGPELFIDKLIDKVYSNVKDGNRLVNNKETDFKLNENQTASFVFNFYLEGIHDNYISNTITFQSMINASQSSGNFLTGIFSDDKNGKYSFVLKDVSKFLKDKQKFYKGISERAKKVIQFTLAAKKEQVIAAEQRKEEREDVKKALLKDVDEDDFIGRYICFVPQMYDQIYDNDGTFYLKNVSWETALKTHLGDIFVLNSNYLNYKDIKTETLKVDGVSPTYLYIRSEQEKQERHSASLVSISSKSNGINKTFGVYDKGIVNAKSMATVRTSQIYLPILAMYDAGARMITRGVVTEVINILDSMENIDSYKLKVVPYSQPFECNFKNEKNQVFFKLKTTIGYPVKSSSNKYNPENVYALQINNVEKINLSSTAKQAGASILINNKLGKWAGDNAPNIEDLIINRIKKENRFDYRPRFMSTGDGNNAVGYVSFAKFMKETPLLLLDTGKEENKLKVFGAEYSPGNSPQISQAVGASQSITPNQLELKNIIMERISGNTSSLQRLFLQNKIKQNNKSSFIRFLNEYINNQPSTSEGKINFNYKNFEEKYKKHLTLQSNLINLHKRGMTAREGAKKLKENPDPYMREDEMERRNALAAYSERLSANQKMNELDEEDNSITSNNQTNLKYNEMLTRLNNSGLISKLSNQTKTAIIEHLKEFYKVNDDNETNRRRFIKEISAIMRSKPLPLLIKRNPIGISIRNIPNIQKYLNKNSNNRSKMNE